MKKNVLSTQRATVEVAVSGQLDLNDVLSIVVTRAEQKYHAEIARLRAAIKDEEGNMNRLWKQACAAVREAAAAAHASQVALLRSVIEPLGGAVTHDIERCDNVKHVLEHGKIETYIIVRGSDRCYYATFTVTADAPQTVRVLHADAKKAEERLNQLKTEAVGWCKKLQNVPMLERQYRAKIAEKKLAEAEGGQELLDTLTSDLDQAILSLPG